MDNIIGTISNFKVDTVLSAVDKYVPGAQNKIKNLADKAKAYMNNVSDLELKVLEATNHEPWGPHGSAMQDITQSAFNTEGFYQIMGVCDQRLAESPENWRLVYKTLLLLEYMCKHGPLSVVEALAAYSRLSHLERLKDRFEYKDTTGRDQGINVRQRAGALVSLVQDKDMLMQEREKAAKNKTKYTGVSSSSAVRYGGFGGSSGSYMGSGSSTSSKYSPRETADSYGNHSTSNTAGSSYYTGSSNSTGFSSAAVSVVSPSSTVTGSGSGSGNGASDNSSSVAADPIEATRRRIARLKAEGAFADGGGDGGASLGLDGGSNPDSPKRPKKLSDVKINPAISAIFFKSGLAPPPPSGQSGSSVTSAGGSGAAAAANPAAAIDLLGDLDAPAPAGNSSGGCVSAADDWDSFATASLTVAAAGAKATAGDADNWDAFDSAGGRAANKQQQKPAADISPLLAPIPTCGPASAGDKAPLPLDDFSIMPVAAMQPAMVNSSFVAAPPPALPLAADPFGPFVAGAPSSIAPAVGGGNSSFRSGADRFAVSSFISNAADDPFAASGGVHMVPVAKKQQAAAAGPKLGPETAKAKDPFADLALL